MEEITTCRAAPPASRTTATPCGTLPVATRTMAVALAHSAHRLASQRDCSWLRAGRSASLPSSPNPPSTVGMTIWLCRRPASLDCSAEKANSENAGVTTSNCPPRLQGGLEQVDDAVGAGILEQTHGLALPGVPRHRRRLERQLAGGAPDG